MWDGSSLNISATDDPSTRARPHWAGITRLHLEARQGHCLTTEKLIWSASHPIYILLPRTHTLRFCAWIDYG